MIAAELVTNALKYGQGAVTVAFRQPPGAAQAVLVARQSQTEMRDNLGRQRSVYAPETKSLTEVAGWSGCAGVKFRRRQALRVEREGLGDEGRG
ncbi:MAG: hypothetical protein ABI224_02845, partial [Acetobacteraceae bacterium]